MVRATTPTFVLTLPITVDLSEANNVYFTISQGRREITKTGDALTVETNVVSVILSQAETLAFNEGEAEIQLNWTYADGSRGCSEVKTIQVGKNLIERVIE